ncbi:MAG: hypothetical protein HOA61_14105 [Bacteroidetes bacterium]|nr:hypothetical protein [Bacteroidota bacterium]MBT7825609.1 hypothetical protein [Bacteroidota bacterium]
MRIFLLFIISLFLSFNSYCQLSKPDFSQIDIQLSRLCQLRAHHVFSEQRNEVMGNFNSMMLEAISHPLSFNYPFDSLERCIYITYSSDSLVRCYCYDNLDGGSFHTYTNITSYYTENGNFQSQLMIPEKESPMIGFDRIIRLNPPEQKLYLFKGFGTYGGGKQHISFQLFKIENDTLSECFDCYEDYSPLFIEQNRGQDFEIEFDQKTQRIEAKVYRFDNETGFYTNEYDLVYYSIQNGLLKQIR